MKWKHALLLLFAPSHSLFVAAYQALEKQNSHKVLFCLSTWKRVQGDANIMVTSHLKLTESGDE